ncbi:hypothetical protein AZI12_04300 [Levilactobacillus brevis]|nr:hypothetical protein AZI12_04300 [Levilactobacillus brevis]
MRVPHTRYPLRIEKSYAYTAGKAVSRAEGITLLLLKSEVKPVINRGTVNDSLYKDDMIDWVESLIERLKELILGSFTDTDAQQMVERFMSAISTSNRANVSSQIQAHELVKHATLLPSGKPVIMAINPVAGMRSLTATSKVRLPKMSVTSRVSAMIMRRRLSRLSIVALPRGSLMVRWRKQSVTKEK